MKYTLFTAFLFSVWWMNAASGKDPSAPCCLTVRNIRVPVKNIVDYTIQESSALCAPRAIRFHTMKNKVICSDPDSDWAKNVMKIVDKRTTTKPSIKPTTCFTSTTNMIPTTTHKTSGTETEISETTTHDHPDCCLTVTNIRAPAENIMDYHIQDSSLCPIRAVRFRTMTNEIICSDPSDSWTIRVMTALTNGPSTEHHVFPTTTAKMISTTVTTTETETSTSETKSISTTTTNKATSDVDGRSSFAVITVQTTKDPENSGTTAIPEVDMRITTAAQIIDTTPPLTTFKKSGPEVAASTKDCCLTVTENRPAFHETVDYRVRETSAEDWDYIQNLNRRKTTEQTDKREFIRKTKAPEQDRVRSTETTDTLQLDVLSEEEKQTSVSLTSEINDPYTNNNQYFCLKKEPVQYFCIRQP